MQQYSELREPRHPRPRFRRIEVKHAPATVSSATMARPPSRHQKHQQRRCSGPGARCPPPHRGWRSPSPSPLQANPTGVLPQYERSHATSLNSQPIYGGADATGQSAIANDASAPTHRCRNPGESLHGGPNRKNTPSLQSPAVMSASLFVPPQTHQRITDLVVPNKAHGLFKCPCHAAPPPHLTGVQSCAHDVALGRVQEMPD